MRVLLPVFSFGLFCGTAQCHGQPEPVLRSSLTPTAPPVAAVPRVTGDARGSFRLGADGNVASVEIISRPALLRDATAKNNRRWKFVPATAKSAANSSYDTAFYTEFGRLPLGRTTGGSRRAGVPLRDRDYPGWSVGDDLKRRQGRSFD